MSEPFSILIAEDNLTSRAFLSRLLQEWGVCDVVGNGREAVELVKAGLEGGAHYDLICLDIVMPELDGIGALKEIRELEARHGLVYGSKILMISRKHESETIRESFRIQCDGYLVKPYTKGALRDKLQELGFQASLGGKT